MAAIRVLGTATSPRNTAASSPDAATRRALGAVKHSLICAIWHMLSTGETYRDLGGDHFTNRDPERQTKRLIAQLERLGHTRHAHGGGRGNLNELFLPGRSGSADRELGVQCRVGRRTSVRAAVWRRHTEQRRSRLARCSVEFSERCRAASGGLKGG